MNSTIGRQRGRGGHKLVERVTQFQQREQRVE